MGCRKTGDGIEDFELHRWFSEGELERCPRCGETARMRLRASSSCLCLACGYVSDAEPTAGPGEGPEEEPPTS